MSVLKQTVSGKSGQAGTLFSFMAPNQLVLGVLFCFVPFKICSFIGCSGSSLLHEGVLYLR